MATIMVVGVVFYGVWYITTGTTKRLVVGALVLGTILMGTIIGASMGMDLSFLAAARGMQG